MSIREPTERVVVERTLRRSRFIGFGVPAANPADADRELKRLKEQFTDASHVVHAYLVGAPTREIGSMSDAGEPKGTAGRPVMEILRGSSVRNVLIAVVRYFGGTKLGTGGLVRAYGDAARAVLERLHTRPLVIRDQLTVTIDYAHHDALLRALDTVGTEVLEEQYETDVRVLIAVDRERVAEVLRTVADLSAGTAHIEPHSP